MIADQAAGGDLKFQAGIAVLCGAHVHEHSLALGQLADDRAGVVLGHVDVAGFYGLELLAVFISLENNLGLADGKLISLAAHHFNEDGQMQLAAAGHLECIG